MSWKDYNFWREHPKLRLVVLGVAFLFVLWLCLREHDPATINFLKRCMVDIGVTALVVIGVMIWERYFGD